MNILSKIVKLKDLVQKINALRKSGQSIVFTNGCFDILHVGHVRYLAAARAEGDILVVGFLIAAKKFRIVVYTIETMK